MTYFELIGVDERSVWQEGVARKSSATERQVIGWVALADVDHLIHARKVPGLDYGGHATQRGDRWIDYIQSAPLLLRPYLEALRREIVAREIRRGGNWHQNAPDGAPVFDDRTVGCFGMRGWGALLAAIWADVDDTDYGYMAFYMDPIEEG